MYVLVLFKAGSGAETSEVDRQHETFIDGLIRRNQILLGGRWAPPAGPFVAAYLLRCDSLDAAREIIGEDPYFHEGIYQAEVVEWKLVGINPNAIEPEVVLSADKLEEYESKHKQRR